jgi:hypothetical protein
MARATMPAQSARKPLAGVHRKGGDHPQEEADGIAGSDRECSTHHGALVTASLCLQIGIVRRMAHVTRPL